MAVEPCYGFLIPAAGRLFPYPASASPGWWGRRTRSDAPAFPNSEPHKFSPDQSGTAGDLDLADGAVHRQGSGL